MIKNTVFILFYLFCLYNINAQKLNLQKISIKEGLSQSTIKQIVPDNFGNIWLATNYGLSKYNGKSFEVFTTSNGLPDNLVSYLLFYKDILYVGTKNGLCFYNGNFIKTNPILDKIKGTVKKIIAQNDDLHVITSKGYYILSTKNNISTIDSVAIPIIISQVPTDAEIDEDGNVWISTLKHGIYFIEKNISTKIQKLFLIQNSCSSTTIHKKFLRIVNFNSSNLFKGDAIISLEFDASKNLLVSDWGNGIAHLKFDLVSNSFTPIYIEFDKALTGNIVPSRFTKIEKDNHGTIYFATDGLGFIKVPLDLNTHENDYYSKSITSINSSNGFFGNNPLCFYYSNFNNLWVGTLNDGLVLITQNNSLSFTQKSGLEEEKVISVHNTKDSSIWLGTYGGGAFKFKDKKFTRCFWDKGITESIIQTITQDGFENIWLGTIGGGINIISKENAARQLNVSKVISKETNLTSNYISYLYKAKNGTVWVGYQNENGVDKIKLNRDFTYTITHYNINNNFNFSTTCIIEDDDNNIWITSNEGVWKLNPITEYINQNYMLYKNIQCASLDWNGNVWLGSSDAGIYILKNKLKSRYFENNSMSNFETIKSQNGLNSNYINTILFLKEKVFVITNNGINDLKIDSYVSKITEIKSLNKGQFFASYDNKPNSAIIDNVGDLYIGSIDGLTMYHNTLKIEDVKKQIELDVYINKLLIENKVVNWENNLSNEIEDYKSVSFNGYFNWYKIPNNLKLDYKHNSISFILNTNYIANQKQINYSYKLLGYDKEYTTIYSTNEITYRNLPAGNYILLYKASLSNDFTNSKEFQYSFSVIPPFWKSIWFYVLCFSLFIIALYFFIKNREKRLKREKLKLELVVKARTADIEKKRGEIELQNTLINGINKDLTDSIVYAKRIQETILPNPIILKNYFDDYCVHYQPRNIVSGDYYWMKEINGLIYVAVVDCTGHGVPGAFMSLITSNILNESVEEGMRAYSPSELVENLRKKINVKLNNNTAEYINDGLDIALVCYDIEKETVQFVNANRPLYVISENELITYSSENISIGGFADFNLPIPSKSFPVKKGDRLFLFSDGLTDQFGGAKNKKYNPNRLRQFLLLNSELPFDELKTKLKNEIKDWQGNCEQTDDILFIGLKI